MQVWKKKTTLCVIGATVLSVGLPSGLLAEGPTAAVRASGTERQRAAAGWLRLESDQRQSRGLAAPLTPLDSQPTSGKRRPFVRFFACQQDLSHQAMTAPLPRSVAEGRELLIVLGAMAGG